MVLGKSRADRKASCGAFFQGELIGFIFHSSGFYRGCSAAFYVGTGIVSSHRGKGVFSRLLEYSLQNLRQSGDIVSMGWSDPDGFQAPAPPVKQAFPVL